MLSGRSVVSNNEKSSVKGLRLFEFGVEIQSESETEGAILAIVTGLTADKLIDRNEKAES